MQILFVLYIYVLQKSLEAVDCTPAWEADAEFDEEPGEKWLTLRKDKFNEQVWYGWRLDPRELVARQPGAAQTPEAQRGARRGGC